MAIPLSSILIAVVATAELAALSVLEGTHLPVFDSEFLDCSNAVAWCPIPELTSADLPGMGSFPFRTPVVGGLSGPPVPITPLDQTDADTPEIDDIGEAAAQQDQAEVDAGDASIGDGHPAYVNATPTVTSLIPGQTSVVSPSGIPTIPIPLTCLKGPAAELAPPKNAARASANSNDGHKSVGASQCESSGSPQH